MTHAFSALDELGDGPGFRKIRRPLGVTAIVFVVGGKDGYVERDGHLVDPADLARRSSFG